RTEPGERVVGARHDRAEHGRAQRDRPELRTHRPRDGPVTGTRHGRGSRLGGERRHRPAAPTAPALHPAAVDAPGRRGPGRAAPAGKAGAVIVEFTAELWAWDARRNDSWTFVSLPVDASDDIRDRTGDKRRGFGSVRVRVTIGTSTWTTSVFPDSGSGAYVLP